MATGSLLVKMLIIYFSINVLLFAGGIRFGNTSVFGDLIAVNNYSADITDSNNQYQLSSNLSGLSPNVNDQTSPGVLGLSFIDVLRAVRDFINFIGFMLVGLPYVFVTLFPPVIQLFVGAPLAFLALIGLIYFARSGQ
jgi:hypothetical protein